MINQNNFNAFIGIDVAKNKVDIFNSQTNKFEQILNTKKDLKKFAKTITNKDEFLVIIDLTGGYEQVCVDVFHDLGFAIHRAEGRRVKAFMRSYGQIAKTDKIDAKALALYGEKMQDRLFLYTPKNYELESIVECISDLADMHQQAKNRYQAPKQSVKVKKIHLETISFIAKKIDGLEVDAKALIMQDSELKRRFETLLTLKGVGEKIAIILLALLPEIGTLNRRQIAALAGVAPYSKDSGSLSGYRFVRYGRPKVKKALFMAALVGIRYNEKIKNFYEHLQNDNNKKKMVALTACMRKILMILNARLKELEPLT